MRRPAPQKAYDVLKLYFYLKLWKVTIQFRKLLMLTEPMGVTTVFTISTDPIDPVKYATSLIDKELD